MVLPDFSLVFTKWYIHLLQTGLAKEIDGLMFYKMFTLSCSYQALELRSMACYLQV